MIIWDLPLRIFHWALMICVFGAIISGKMNEWYVHERFGLAILALISFRIIWGFIGSETAQFRNFLKGPHVVLRALIAFWRHRSEEKRPEDKRSEDKAGHSPLGGYAIIALLAIPMMMALTGSISTDDIFYDGPFYHLMPQMADQAGKIHHLGEKLVFLIIILHLSAIAYYRFRLGKNLIKPMVIGKGPAKQGPAKQGPSGALSLARTWAGLILLALLMASAQLATQLRPNYF